jgi:hypothetical protein
MFGAEGVWCDAVEGQGAIGEGNIGNRTGLGSRECMASCSLWGRLSAGPDDKRCAPSRQKRSTREAPLWPLVCNHCPLGLMLWKRTVGGAVESSMTLMPQSVKGISWVSMTCRIATNTCAMSRSERMVQISRRNLSTARQIAPIWRSSVISSCMPRWRTISPVLFLTACVEPRTQISRPSLRRS